MNLAKPKVEDLFEDGTSVPEVKTSGVQPNVFSFPKQKEARTQDIVLRMLLDGKLYDEIATAVGLTADQVRKIVRSEWAKQEIAKQLESGTEGEKRDTLETLLRLQAFDAVDRIGVLMKCGHSPTELGACKLALQYVLAVPTKSEASPKGAEALPRTPDAVREELIRLEAEIERRKNPNSTQNG